MRAAMKETCVFVFKEKLRLGQLFVIKGASVLLNSYIRRDYWVHHNSEFQTNGVILSVPGICCNKIHLVQNNLFLQVFHCDSVLGNNYDAVFERCQIL